MSRMIELDPPPAKELLRCFGADQCWVLKAEATKALKKRIKEIYYSHSWPDEAPTDKRDQRYTGWENAEVDEIFLDVSQDANCRRELVGLPGVGTILRCIPKRWPGIQELRKSLRETVFGRLEIFSSDASWLLRCESEPGYSDIIQLRFASALALAAVNTEAL